MSPQMTRIMLAIAMLPLLSFVHTLVWQIGTFVFSFDNFVGLLLSGICSVFFLAGAVIYWWLLWRSSVRWTPRRIRLTWGAVVGSAVLGIAHSLTLPYNVSSVGTAIWLLTSTLIWRETRAERTARYSDPTTAGPVVSCPACNYNMAGLRESKCPECGASLTLDQLFAEQPAVRENELKS